MALDLELCKRRIDQYNADSYRGRPNIELDRHGYGLFARGLPDDSHQLTEMVRFIGEDYGGAQDRFLPAGYAAESVRIAQQIQPLVVDYQRRVTSQRPLRDRVPQLDDLAFLLVPFHATKKWLVWASKFLHFLAPQTFAILDSRAENTLGFKRTGDSPRDYFRFLKEVRRVLHDEADLLRALGDYDPEPSPELKVLDKVLYEEGNKTSRRPAQMASRSSRASTAPSPTVDGSRSIQAWITNIASHAERARTGDRFELCISKDHANLFPAHKGWFELVVSNTTYRVQIGNRDGVRHLYLLTKCIGPGNVETKITRLLQSVGLRVGDRPLLLMRGPDHFELRSSIGEQFQAAQAAV